MLPPYYVKVIACNIVYTGSPGVLDDYMTKIDCQWD